MGILSCAFGMGFLGAAYQLPEMMICGFAGGTVHLLNHAFFKGGLFLGAGSVFKSCGTLEMDKMGGLLRRMPRTGLFFILNAFGLCGLPPFAGFAGEFLIYCGAFAGISAGIPALSAVSAAVLIILALTGGLAAMTFAKAVGAVFCGEPRTGEAAKAGEVPMTMNIPILLLFLLSCLLLFILPEMLCFCAKPVFPGCENIIEQLASDTAAVGLISFAATVLTAIVLSVRSLLCRRNCGERISITWDCGYSAPDAKMEYTGSSFSRTAEDFFRIILHPVRKIDRPEGIFPEKAAISSETDDGSIRFLWRPVANFLGNISEKIHFLQSGSLHFYLLTAVITLVGMLLFALWK
jgi:NADH:ubiquinone oxidoreductase subunit 5 (subunit L)/multisubunit Na+/H+ antiporter MnhA subunit